LQKIIEIGSSLLKLFKIKLVTFYETRCIYKLYMHTKQHPIVCIQV